jgi:hypothetical protein
MHAACTRHATCRHGLWAGGRESKTIQEWSRPACAHSWHLNPTYRQKTNSGPVSQVTETNSSTRYLKGANFAHPIKPSGKPRLSKKYQMVMRQAPHPSSFLDLPWCQEKAVQCQVWADDHRKGFNFGRPKLAPRRAHSWHLAPETGTSKL